MYKSETQLEAEILRTVKTFPNGKIAQAYRLGRKKANLELSESIEERKCILGVGNADTSSI